MSVADELRRDQRAAVSRLSVAERIRLALELGLRDLEIFMEASGLERQAARRELRRRRAAGRRPSKSASG
jgi:ribosomal protein S11